jgi:phosphatidylglycerol:prolipoprotein diacylglycerol transferase
MRPILFRLGPWEVHTYGVMLMVAFVAGVLVARPRARAAGIDSRLLAIFSIWILVAAIVGARLTYVALNVREFAGDWWSVVNPVRNGRLEMTGLVMNGGVVAAAGALVGVARWNGLPVLRTMDVFAPALPLGEFFTRIGCFLNGCCYGEPSDRPWAVVFPRESQAGAFQRGPSGDVHPIHPTQLYSAAYGLVIFFLLLAIERRWKRFEGFSVLVFCLLYGVARFAVEHFRHYRDESGLLLGLTHNQILSIVLVLGSAVGLALLGARAARVRTRPSVPR